MSSSKLILFAVTATAGVVTLLFLQHRSKLRLADENQSLRQQNAELRMFESKVEQLSGQLAQAKSSRDVLQGQLRDLPRLRGELAALHEENKNLEERLAGISQGPEPQPTVATTNASPSVAVAKEAWAFSGYSTPGAAVQSAMWALREGDPKAFLASLTPEARKQIMDRSLAKPEYEVFPDLPKVISYSIEQQKNLSDDEVSFLLVIPLSDVQATSDTGRMNSERRVVGVAATAKRINNEWKLNWDW